ncbi:sigma-54-dependent Fis family transcriptional regulator [Ammoniphilus sp. CFH 90114]|uniref:sigma-54 interaction domain-containing protein n=1 Tax=Ammoniphilus sp. CFH 90114 TaxID=2493665 RepID=UPI00100EC8B5|nr:sigma 54-interacting transcriptional regulator [Ammoniphilus sp. CFH 90114]RXT08770.1 PAS domain S-box protein [Ammoniphilus sp. CFH 90114]
MLNREHILEKILDEVNEGVHVVDERGTSILYNRKMEEIEAMNKHDVLHKNIAEVFHFPSDQDSTLLQALNKGVSSHNVRQTYFNAKGKEITTINHTFPIIQDGKIHGAIEIANDVTKVERLIRENILEKGVIKYTFDSIIGESSAIKEVIHNAKRAARTSSSVLIVGETGTGKELFAQSIHYASMRQAAPFLSQNCAALPDTLIEGLLFGTMKGAFTGAIERPGLFEQSEGGTLFLDEMNSLSIALQAKLLHALQERVIRRIGDTRDRKIDVRILAAINEDPIEAIAKHHMRKDLFYRLGVVTLFVPPLRERKEDIILLVDHFIKKYNRLFQMEIQGVSREVHQFFMDYDWPGNVRELQHMIEGAMNLIVDEPFIQYNHLPIHHLRKKVKITEASDPSASMMWSPSQTLSKELKTQVEEFERFYVEKTLKEFGGNISQAAKQLGISRQSLQYRLRKFRE